jgi:hypothetical protein
MVRDLRERGLYGRIDCSRRGLPGHDSSSAVVRCLNIHEAPRCCDWATLQDKSVLDCGAIQKNPKRCKNLTEVSKRARADEVRVNEFRCRRRWEMFIFARHPRATVEGFDSRPRRTFCSGDG